MSERDWIEGNRAAWRRFLGECITHLAGSRADKPALDLAAIIAEREDVLRVLRELCAAHGDNDWPDDLHLGDALEKHLGRYLPERRRKKPVVRET